MTPETSRNLKALANLANNLSRKQGKITKADIKQFADPIFSIINSGDVEIQMNSAVFNIASGFIRNWLGG